jgi:hypothetical protein
VITKKRRHHLDGLLQNLPQIVAGRKPRFVELTTLEMKDPNTN